MTDKTTLGDRMKGYENVERRYLYQRSPVIIRLDMKAGHTLTRKHFPTKPYCLDFISLMNQTTEYLIENIQNVKLAYVQSDEISLLLCDYDDFQTQAWFGNNLQKLVSVSAGMASAEFTRLFQKETVVFDARAFNLTKEEVFNYFLWRSQDCSKNSIQAHAQSMFSHKSLQGLNCDQLIYKMMIEKDFDWSKQPDYIKNGTFLKRDHLGTFLFSFENRLTDAQQKDKWEKFIKPLYDEQLMLLTQRKK